MPRCAWGLNGDGEFEMKLNDPSEGAENKLQRLFLPIQAEPTVSLVARGTPIGVVGALLVSCARVLVERVDMRCLSWLRTCCGFRACATPSTHGILTCALQQRASFVVVASGGLVSGKQTKKCRKPICDAKTGNDFARAMLH